MKPLASFFGRRALWMGVWAAACMASADAQTPPRFRVTLPPAVLADVPQGQVTILALTPDGDRDRAFSETVQITGLELRGGDGAALPLPGFTAGELVLQTNHARRERVHVTADRVVVEHASGRAEVGVRRLPGWFSLIPPLLAVALAIWWRNVLPALFVAIWAGAWLLSGDGPLLGLFTSLLRTFDSVLIEQLANPDHLLIIVFTIFLGATVGVMNRSGGTSALVKQMAASTQTRRRGQLLTFLMGIVVFFDDYANCLLVGTTMRPVTDRLRISREKLAFIVDATAAPVASLAIISTWIGVEISYIADTFQTLGATHAGEPVSGFSLFVASLPYRFYPWLLLFFIVLLIVTGRDFGPMLKAEERARDEGVTGTTRGATTGLHVEYPATSSANALIPLGVLIGGVIGGLYWSGLHELHVKGTDASWLDIRAILAAAASSKVLLYVSALSSFVALACAVRTRALSLDHAVEGWVDGAKSMMLGLVILTLAWGIAGQCDATHLNTAGYIVAAADGRLSIEWMPALTFIVAAAISFATGSSWATMALLMPLFIAVSWSLLVPTGHADPHHPLMIAVIGSVLAGSVFGDHCSPISDTTVLSSLGSSCDHLAHVETQIPYAFLVGMLALLCGYVPAGWLATRLEHWGAYASLAVGGLLLAVMVRCIGRKV